MLIHISRGAVKATTGVIVIIIIRGNSEKWNLVARGLHGEAAERKIRVLSRRSKSYYYF